MSARLVPLDSLILRYLRNHPDGLRATQILAWVKSRKHTYTLGEFETELFRMRDAGHIACTNGLWWKRESRAE